MLTRIILFSACTFLAAISAACADQLVRFPNEATLGCRGGRAQLYDECGSQFEIFEAAQLEAQRTGKVLLVSYGAEWCIWCHVFDKFVSGERGKFTYSVEGDRYSMRERKHADQALADDLRKFVAETFVIVHIEGQYSPDGDAVLTQLDAWGAYENWIPFIFTVKDNRLAAALASSDDLPGLELRRDGFFDQYRGYDRQALLNELQRLAHAAR